MLARHSLVWLHPEGWQEAESSASADCRNAIRQWAQADRPLVARRPDVDIDGDTCCLGLALPPDPESGIKRRIGLRVTRNRVRRIDAPLAVAQVVEGAPQPWQPLLARLNEQASAVDASLRVFGSLALQTLTGLPYLTPSSDIDLLFTPANVLQLDQGMHLLAEASQQLPLDGELVFPGGQAVAWKEWANATCAGDGMRVLAKDMRSVRLMTQAELRMQLKTETGAGK